MNESNISALATLERIASALERLAPSQETTVDWHIADAYIWDSHARKPFPVENVSAIDLSLIIGVDQARDTLLTNTRQFAQSFSANNALLWGARGTGKSSLVKAVHMEVNRELPHALALVEIHREDIEQLPLLMAQLKISPRRSILFCDDLTFDGADASYKSLKTALEGGIEGRPENVVFYATSNRRHMLPREMIENERGTAIHPGEAIEEKVSLSDRFGLWLGFHACTLEMYLAIVESYAKRFGIDMPREDLRQQAFLWANARGARSGRVAWQFMQDLAGRLQKKLT